ncbi:hypothetical protein [Labilibaculum sp.]|uniref:hypothetical protein n=1 Tax=Labilibaculum sp. TaxID=2060723 RepID=UPI002AA7F6F4|nr:hypothetical protein [Labilibaculum sp.]MBN2595705.1 hypothetical protein [Marinifilaceae bacterium]
MILTEEILERIILFDGENEYTPDDIRENIYMHSLVKDFIHYTNSKGFNFGMNSDKNIYITTDIRLRDASVVFKGDK